MKWTLGITGAIVALLTIYALILPATSLSGEAFCGSEEHVHDECCYTKTLVCEIPEAPAVESHTHDDSCYEVSKVLVCTIPEGTPEAAEDSPAPAPVEGTTTEESSDTEGTAEDKTGEVSSASAHVHDENCYVEEKVLVCGLEETDGNTTGHVHTDACYESTLTCEKREHTHDLACYSNPEADLESSSDWRATLPHEDELTGIWAQDVLIVAESQLGYAESSANYTVDDDGNTKGYTRYGAWYGDPYGDWCAMFVSFCLHYAGIPVDDFPRYANCQEWIETLSSDEWNLYRPVVDGQAIVPTEDGVPALAYNPQPGDLIFFDWGSGPAADHVGLVHEITEATETEPAKVRALEGNSSECVQYVTYELRDSSIIGYADLPENPTEDIVLPEEESEEPLESEEVAEEPVVLTEDATEYDFVHETDEYTLVIHVAGAPVFETDDASDATDAAANPLDHPDNIDAADESDVPLTWDQAVLVVTDLSTQSAEYQEFSTYVDENEDMGDLLDLNAFEFALYIQNKKLDLSRCIITAEITPKESMTTIPNTVADAVSEDGDAIAEEAEIGVVLTAMQSGHLRDAPTGTTTADRSLDDEEAAAEATAFLLTPAETQTKEGSSNVKAGSIADESTPSIRSTSVFVARGATETPLLTMEVTGDEPIAISASGVPNPQFKVQYYAYLERTATSGGTSLALINTDNGGNGTGGNLPKNNGETPSNGLKYIYLENAGNGSKQVATNLVLTEVYEAKDCEYIYHPNLSYFNRMYENGNYNLEEIWILKDGVTDAGSINESDWDIYEDPSIVHFTSRDVDVRNDADNITLLIEDDTVIRLVFDTSTSTYTNSATFHDYDITNGILYTDPELTTEIATQTGTVYTRTDSRKINNANNYSGSGAKFAFGNENTGTGLSDERWKGNYLNKNNATDGTPNAYKGCTFKLVTGLGSNGSIVFADGVDAPNIFGTASERGKTSFNGTLGFLRSGDTYTLTSVDGTKATGLQYFNNPTCNGHTYTNIWTNNFWPLDSADWWGTSGHDLKFGNYDKMDMRKWTNKNDDRSGRFPFSDDGKDHNSYFGMQYTVDFKLAEDYRGPLEYLFFGDDDMWVFLTGPDGKTDLVCDIGGVHSSVGEYVNLWDYIKKGESGTFRLSFFYTERGASGSTCYMHFTLPSVSSITPEQNTGALSVSKQVTGDGAGDTTKEFDFTIKLRDANGNALLDDYSYSRYSATGDIIEQDIIVYDGGNFRLRHGERVVISYLPLGTTYEIVEAPADGYSTGNRVGSGAIVQSNTATGNMPDASMYSVEYENELIYELPATGGIGVIWFTMGGAALVGAAFVIYRRILQRREEDTI